MNSHLTFTAVLIAGGESRRMGVDKATLEICGRPLWARQLGILRELHPARLIVSARSRPWWCPPEVEVVPDTLPSQGPLSGLAAAMEQISTTHLLVLAIDLPRMTSAHLEKLCLAAAPGMAVVPRKEDDWEPLCAVYPRETLTVAKTMLAGPNVSLRGLIEQLVERNQVRFYPIPGPETVLYENVNTPQEWRDLCK